MRAASPLVDSLVLSRDMFQATQAAASTSRARRRRLAYLCLRGEALSSTLTGQDNVIDKPVVWTTYWSFVAFGSFAT